MAGLWSVRKHAASRRAPAVWPCARQCALLRPSQKRFHGSCVGRPAVLDPVGWGTPPPTSPRAADRSGRRAPPPGLCVGAALRRACTERAWVWPSIAKLAESRPLVAGVEYPSYHGTWGALGVFGECTGGAFASSSPCLVRASASLRAPPQGRTPGSASGGRDPPTPLFVAAWCPVRTVHWLSTARGGGDAVVGGVEQYHRWDP